MGRKICFVSSAISADPRVELNHIFSLTIHWMPSVNALIGALRESRCTGVFNRGVFNPVSSVSLPVASLLLLSSAHDCTRVQQRRSSGWWTPRCQRTLTLLTEPHHVSEKSPEVTLIVPEPYFPN